MRISISRNVLAVIAAGALIAGGGIAASAHSLSGLTRLADDSASSPRVEQPEPSESPEVDEMPVVEVTPTPEPSETPGPEPSETPEAMDTENEDENDDETETRAPARAPRVPVVVAPRGSEHEGDHEGGGHDD